jgi:hypothetical protein
MRRAEKYRWHLGRLLWLLLALLSSDVMAKPGSIMMGAKEQTFPVLETKTGAYTNVTVTKKTKDWVFILHSQGVCNIKATDLSTEARIALGYEEAPKKGEQIQVAATTSHEGFGNLSHLKLEEVKKFAADWRVNRKEKEAEMKAFITANPMALCTVLGILGFVYIFSSTCFWMICRKTHNAPGPLVWVPILQLIPLLRAANMPRVWFFAFFIPILNIIAQILFSIKIVKSRGKSPWVAFLLILPPTSLFAFLYLAFSQSAPVQMETNEVLSLETA